ncbi:MAG TPA: CSLREA domain-containing protein, partial [Anaerolineae bacterium]|nr:CSLREA domain-containing protein [Anaerolineae bacterium]
MDSKVARFSKQTMRVVVFCLAVLVFALLGVQQQANAQGTATLVINTSKQVDVGQPIEITLRITGASDIAGYEMNIRYDSTAAHLYGIHQRSNDLKKGGRDIVPLQVEQANGGVAVGLASCSVNDCVHNSGARNERGGAGNFLLGTVLIGTDEAGPLEIRFDSAKFVDAAGNPVPVTLSTQRVMVQVAQGGKAHPAQPSTWQLPASNAARRTPELRALDRTDDKKVNHADVMELALAWTDVRNSGSPCGNLPDPSLDLNGDGCIDVADVQIAAANTGKVVAANSVAAAAPLTFVVNTANDSADATPGNGICDAQGGCTLRAAIDESNAHPGPDFIQFNIPGSGVKTINLKTNLPTLSDTTGPTTIDGYTQPGASPNTDAQKSNAQIMIQLNGQGPNAFDGIRISSAGNVVRGLALYNLRRSFYIYGSGATNNSIIGNFIGTDAAGQFGATTSNTIASGVYIDVGANGNH